MGRLSAYAKNRILKLRFKKNKRIIHIVEILRKEDNIKVSRQAVSTFLKKYLETNSIYDKPRTGRKRKLTQEEIQLIGQVTRLNRDITARAIKEYLNLNVSTYTILRATKLFEWNKINPNSNDSKKAAALERQLNGEIVKPPRTISAQSGKRVKRKSTTENSLEQCSTVQVISMSDDELEHYKSLDDKNSSMNEIETVDLSKMESSQHFRTYTKDNSHHTTSTAAHNEHNFSDPEKIDLNLLTHKELLTLKNLSCSPMSFATKILFKVFKIEELHGHNVSGKTLNKNLKAKLPLDTVRVGYIKFLVEKYYNEKECKEMLSGVANQKQDLWKSCHTAINKSILISERKSAAAIASGTEPNTSANADGIQQLTNAFEMLNEQPEISKIVASEMEDSESDDSDDDDDDDSSDSSSSSLDSVKKEKIIKKNIKNQPNNSRRRSNRLRKPNLKFTEFEDDDSDEDNEGNEKNNEHVTRIKEEDEVELIQNIENRQKSKQTTKAKSAPVSKQPLSIISPQTSQQPPVTPSNRLKRRAQISKPEEEPSSEASAAANIAAAMKKRFVVIATNQ